MKDIAEFLEYHIKIERERLITKFQKILRNMHDTTFLSLSFQDRVEYIRKEIEDELEKWEKMAK